MTTRRTGHIAAATVAAVSGIIALAAPGRAAADQEPAAAPAPVQMTRTIRAGDREYVADFGRLAVPADRADPRAAPIEIAFVRLRATAAAPAAPVFYLAGTPGAASPERGNPKWAPYLELGDVVLMDQRGVGASRPVVEWTPPDWDPAVVFGDRETATAAVVEAAREAAAAWRQRGVDVAGINVRESAADVDALRAALAYETIRIIGHSAGSHLGMEVVRRHPERVERFVSFGTFGPGDIQKPPSELDESLAAISDLVARDERVGAAMPDFGAAVRRAVEDLAREPLPVEIADERTGAMITVPLGPFGFQWILLYDLGDTSDLPVFPRLVHSVGARDASVVRWFVAKRYRQWATIPVAVLANRAASGATAARWAQIEREAPASVFGRARTHYSPEIDAALGVRDLGDDFRADVRSDVPALFVSGTLDENAPPAQAERARAGFTMSAHVIVENGGHESILAMRQVEERVLRFLSGAAVADERLVAPPISFIAIEGPVAGALHPAVAGE